MKNLSCSVQQTKHKGQLQTKDICWWITPHRSANSSALASFYPHLCAHLFLMLPVWKKNWGAQESLTYQGTHAPKSQRFFWNCLWPAQAADKFYFVIFKLTRMAAAAEHQGRQWLWGVQLNTAIKAPICPLLKLKCWDRFTWSFLDSHLSLKLNNLVTKCTEKFLVLWIILCFLS